VKEKDVGWISEVSSVLPISEGGVQTFWQKWGMKRVNSSCRLEELLLMKLDT
jgi:hypothetical protein